MSDLATYSKEIKEKSFWPYAKVTNTYKRFSPGVTKLRQKYDLMFGSGKFRGMRKFKHPDGRTKRTVEIEI